MIAHTPQTKTILIVEDDIDIGYFLAQAFREEEHYKVLFATDGFQALKMVHTVIPHVILLDYVLPRMNGLQIIEQLRASEQFQQTPIILMSANLPQDISQRDDVLILHKPFDLDVLLTKVKEILHG